jgi:FAD/FMN-containing dehydrogenase
MLRRDFLKGGLALTAAATLSHAYVADGSAISTDVALDVPNTRPGPPDLRKLTGHVILRGDADFEEARVGRNTNALSLPCAVVFCKTVEDVVNAVNWVRTHSVPFRVRCGRHSYEGYSCVDDGVVIDIHDLRHCHYNPAIIAATFGSGMSLAAVYEFLWAQRMTIPGGSCPTVGLSGHALGGGYGLLSRAMGMACDSVLEIEIVLADGRVVRANSKRHSDLYWACRGGGGGNFGVVTSFVFKVHPINRVSIFRIDWNWADMETALRTWQQWAPSTDNRLTSVLVMKSKSGGKIWAVGQFVGPDDELKQLLSPLRKAGTPTLVNVETVSFMDAVETFSGQKPSRDHWKLHWNAENSHFKNSSDFASKPMTTEAIAVIRHALENAPGEACYVQLEAYGGAINDIAPNATAFIHRAGTLCNLQYQSYWGHTQESAPYVTWIETLRNNMQPYMSGRAYSNYCDSGISNSANAYYGDNLMRLAAIKGKYDPHNLFHFPQSIPINSSKSLAKT